jgi:hypothetical protein
MWKGFHFRIVHDYKNIFWAVRVLTHDKIWFFCDPFPTIQKGRAIVLFG